MNCFWGHHWPKWSEPTQKKVAERFEGEVQWLERTITVQERICTRCGQYDVRRIVIR